MARRKHGITKATQKARGSFKCPFCPETFCGWKTTTNHIQRVHEFEEKLAREEQLERKRQEDVIARKQQRSEKARGKYTTLLDEFYANRNPELEAYAMTNEAPGNPVPAADHLNTFSLRTTRTVEMEDVKSDDSDIDEEPFDPRSWPRYATRLNIADLSDSESDTEFNADVNAPECIPDLMDFEKEKQKERRRRKEGRSVYLVSKRVVDCKEEQKLRSVEKQKLLFDTSGEDETKGPFAPFKTGKEFKRARWLTMHRATNRMITEGFNTGLLSGCSGSCSGTVQMVRYLLVEGLLLTL